MGNAAFLQGKIDTLPLDCEPLVGSYFGMGRAGKAGYFEGRNPGVTWKLAYAVILLRDEYLHRGDQILTPV